MYDMLPDRVFSEYNLRPKPEPDDSRPRRQRFEAFAAVSRNYSTDSSTRRAVSDGGGAIVYRRRLQRGWKQPRYN